MKILLVAINAKYIHSNPAVYSLKANAGKAKENIEIVEYTINNYLDDILMDIYKRKPDVLAFSCYIWNINLILDLLPEVNKLLKKVPIWLGGPEVSYYPETIANSFPFVKGIFAASGEKAFREVMEGYVEAFEKTALDNFAKNGFSKTDIGGIVSDINKSENELDHLEFLYEDLNMFHNKIIYYESSRGCPYGCSYCLSAAETGLSYRSLEKIKKELKTFIDAKVRQVKFVDRTFNCKKEHALEIWKFLIENDNNITNFHFEVAADILTNDEISLIEKMRPGLIQLEAGVQSTNEKTLEVINRKTDLKKLKENVKRLKSIGNAHIHLDLIAGLPFEDIEGFKKSFDEVYKMEPDNLQLGFLKVLKGTPIYEKVSEYQIVYKSKANYEVLSTKWLSYSDILELKDIEGVVENYYNTGQFKYSIKYLERFFESPYEMYKGLARFYYKNAHFEKHSRMNNYEILLDYVENLNIYQNHNLDSSSNNNLCLDLNNNLCTDSNNNLYPDSENFKEADSKMPDADAFKELLVFDLYLRENLKKRPDFAGEPIYYKGRNKHVEKFSRDVRKLALEGIDDKTELELIFDYDDRNPVTNDAKVCRFN